MDFSPRNLRIRFHQLARDIKSIEDATRPLREERDALVRSIDQRVKELETQYLAAEGPLFDMKQELATIARALKGQTGKDPLIEEAEARALAVSTAAGSEPEDDGA